MQPKVNLIGNKNNAKKYYPLAEKWLLKLKRLRGGSKPNRGLKQLTKYIKLPNATMLLSSSAVCGERAWIRGLGGFLLEVGGRGDDRGLPISNYFGISGTQEYDELPEIWWTHDTLPIPKYDGELEGRDSANTEDFEEFNPDNIISEIESSINNELYAKITIVLQDNRIFLINRFSQFTSTPVFDEVVGGTHSLSYQIINALGGQMALGSVMVQATGTSGMYTIYNITITFSELLLADYTWNGIPTTRARYIPTIIGDGPSGVWMEPTAPNELINGGTNSYIDVENLELELGVPTLVDVKTIAGFPDGSKDINRYIRLNSQSVREDGLPGFYKSFSIILENVPVQSFFNMVEEDSSAFILWETWDAVNDPSVNLPPEILNSGYNPDYEEPWEILEIVDTSAPGGDNSEEMLAEPEEEPEGGGGGGR